MPGIWGKWRHDPDAYMGLLGLRFLNHCARVYWLKQLLKSAFIGREQHPSGDLAIGPRHHHRRLSSYMRLAACVTGAAQAPKIAAC